MSAQYDEQQQPAAGYVPMSNDTKLEAKLHFFSAVISGEMWIVRYKAL